MSDQITGLLERHTAFQHSRWDRWDYLALRQQPRVQAAEQQSLRDLGYSVVQDSFYCLAGCWPRPDTPLTAFWEQAAQSAGFAGLARTFSANTPAARQEAVLALAEQVHNRLQPQPAAPDEGSEENPDPPARPVTAEVSFAFDAEAVQRKVGAMEALAAFLTELRPGQRVPVAEELLRSDVDLRALAAFLGWSSRVVSGAARRGRAAAGELTGFGAAGWGDCVRPDEMLGVVDGEPTALARLAESALTTRKYVQQQPQGQGPVILLRDETGSMLDPDGAPLRTARAFEVALAVAFNREHRDLLAVAWSSRGTRSYAYGDPGLQAHLHAFLGGLTQIGQALQEAVRLARDYVAGADLLVVTDGLLQRLPTESTADFTARLSDSLHEFREMGGRCWVVVVLAASVPDSLLQSTLGWADGWVRLESLHAGVGLADLLTQVATRRAPSRQLL